MKAIRSSQFGNYIKYDLLMTDREYEKLKKTAWLHNVTMADFIRSALSLKYTKLAEDEIRRNHL